jgi:hypothetical protein
MKRLRHIANAFVAGAASDEAGGGPAAAVPLSSSGRKLVEIARGERGIPAHLNRQPSSFRPVHIGRDGQLLPREVEAITAAMAAPGSDEPVPPRAEVQFSADGREIPRPSYLPRLAEGDHKGYQPSDSGLPTRRQELGQLLKTLGPQPQLSVADCTPSGVTSQGWAVESSLMRYIPSGV